MNYDLNDSNPQKEALIGLKGLIKLQYATSVHANKQVVNGKYVYLSIVLPDPVVNI